MSTERELAPLVLIVSGPSGSGKSTLVQRILELPGTMPSVSCTTRSRRATEATGKCYDFVTEAEFDAMVARGEFLEYACVFGKHSYGTPKKWLDIAREQNKDLVLEIDVQGAEQVLAHGDGVVALGELKPAPNAAFPSPVRSSSAADRPAIIITKASAGPSTSGPRP